MLLFDRHTCRRTLVRGLWAFAALSLVVACGSKSNPAGTAPVEDGAGGSLGEGGTGGNPPHSGGPTFVDRITVGSKIEKIDLLFMIDNSISMADKQQILKDAVPSLVRRLVSPSCIDQDTGELVAFDGTCPAGSRREFAPIEDVHIGVITSSLGGHGGPNNACAQPTADAPHVNDRAELLPNVRAGLASDDEAGFLRWRGADLDDEDELVGKFTSHVVGVGERGCGFEASLESWYRFLIDPEPPVDMRLGNAANGEHADFAYPTAINEQLLAQRAAFLRPDSLVAIIMLSDEDDCSIRDGGTDWLAANPSFRFRVASSACETDPNDPCCYSCMTQAPAGCTPDTATCSASPSTAPELAYEDDSPNLRCDEQKRRFGVDFLYAPQRYLDALTKPTVRNRSGESVPNPLFAPAPGGMPRDPNLVFLAGIVGVPWQDIATEESLEPESETLVFLKASELESMDRWSMILGDPAASPPVPPTDPLMRMSLGPARTGTHPITGEDLVTADEAVLGNSINGHEFEPVGDRQFACIFRLPEPIAPESCASKPAGACDCNMEGAAQAKIPLCYNTPQSPFSTTQYSAKAYPAPRILRVLKSFGENSIVASICPKHLDLPTSNPNYGYNPAIGALLERLGEVLAGRCLPHELDVDADGNVPCSVVEVAPASVADPRGCGRAGRGQVSDEVDEAIREQLKEIGACATDQECASFALCTIEPLRGADREACLLDAGSGDFAPGYCYIDPALGPGVAGGTGPACTAEQPELCSNPLVDVCSASERRLLRFVGSEDVPTPALGTTTFVACGEPDPEQQ